MDSTLPDRLPSTTQTIVSTPVIRCYFAIADTLELQLNLFTTTRLKSIFLPRLAMTTLPNASRPILYLLSTISNPPNHVQQSQSRLPIRSVPRITTVSLQVMFKMHLPRTNSELSRSGKRL